MRVDIKQVVTVAFPAKATFEGGGEWVMFISGKSNQADRTASTEALKQACASWTQEISKGQCGWRKRTDNVEVGKVKKEEQGKTILGLMAYCKYSYFCSKWNEKLSSGFDLKSYDELIYERQRIPFTKARRFWKSSNPDFYEKAGVFLDYSREMVTISHERGLNYPLVTHLLHSTIH